MAYYENFRSSREDFMDYPLWYYKSEEPNEIVNFIAWIIIYTIVTYCLALFISNKIKNFRKNPVFIISWISLVSLVLLYSIELITPAYFGLFNDYLNWVPKIVNEMKIISTIGEYKYQFIFIWIIIIIIFYS